MFGKSEERGSRTLVLTGEEGAKKHVLDSVRWTDARAILMKAAHLYEKGRPWREQMRRWTNYTMGRQWEDYIEDPDSLFRLWIKEKDYIRRSGFQDLVYNIMSKPMKATCGVYTNNAVPPTVSVKGEDNTGLGEMVTCALRSACEQNKVNVLMTGALQEAWMKAMFLASVRYEYMPEKEMSDVVVRIEDFYKLIVEQDLRDKLLRDVRFIGMIRDMTFDVLCKEFARNEEEVGLLAREYGFRANEIVPGWRYAFQGDYSNGSLKYDGFFEREDPTKCRVYEIWTLETEQVLWAHDTAAGKEELRDVREKDDIDKENAMRLLQAAEEGVEPMLIEYEWRIREYWYVRYITPSGKCIREMESPYSHHSHPFVIGAFPMVDGEIHSPAEEVLDVQRAFNRTLSQIDFMRQRGAKAPMVADRGSLGEMTEEELADKVSRNDELILLNLRNGAVAPQQLRTATIQQGDIEMAQLYEGYADKTSGVSAAMRGERAAADTPASLYAQMAQNSETNIAMFMQWFCGCVDDVHWKMMKLQQQYYDEGRYLPLAGDDFAAEAHYYRAMEARDVDLALEMYGMQSVSYFKQDYETALRNALQSQAIDWFTYATESPNPFAKKAARRIKKAQEEG